MTWNGAQGFQTPIEPESFTVKNMGVYGSEHTERGLTCTNPKCASEIPHLDDLDVEFYFSGHMTPRTRLCI
jgi:carboxypeptidase D